MVNRVARSFTDTVDMYAPSAFTTDTDGFVKTAAKYPATPTLSAQKVSFQTESFVTEPGKVSRDLHEHRRSFITVHVLSTCVIDTEWVMQLKTPGHPEYGKWYVVRGWPNTKVWRAKVREVFVLPSIRPPGVPA